MQLFGKMFFYRYNKDGKQFIKNQGTKIQDLLFDIIKTNYPLLVSAFDVKYVSTGSKGEK